MCMRVSWVMVLLKGNQADQRMRAASKRRGIEITSISRPIRPSDFRDFDLILAMDQQNRGRNRIDLMSSLSVMLSFWLDSCFSCIVSVICFVYIVRCSKFINNQPNQTDSIQLAKCNYYGLDWNRLRFSKAEYMYGSVIFFFDSDCVTSDYFVLKCRGYIGSI